MESASDALEAVRRCAGGSASDALGHSGGASSSNSTRELALLPHDPTNSCSPSCTLDVRRRFAGWILCNFANRIWNLPNRPCGHGGHVCPSGTLVQEDRLGLQTALNN